MVLWSAKPTDLDGQQIVFFFKSECCLVTQPGQFKSFMLYVLCSNLVLDNVEHTHTPFKACGIHSMNDTKAELYDNRCACYIQTQNKRTMTGNR